MKFFVKEEKRNLKKGMGCWMEAPPPQIKMVLQGAPGHSSFRLSTFFTCYPSSSALFFSK